jgi:hypothetical protein
VNPRVHELYAERAAKLAEKHAKVHAAMKALARE